MQVARLARSSTRHKPVSADCASTVSRRRQVGGAHLGVARDRHREFIAEALKQPRVRAHHALAVHAGQLGGALMLGHAAEVIERRLRGPADVEAGADPGARPLEHGAEIHPVIHRLERQGLDRRAGHHHSVEMLAADLAPAPVERRDVALRRAPGLIGIRHAQRHLDRDRGRAEQPADLRLGRGLFRHQVDEADAQRPRAAAVQRSAADDLHAFRRQRRCGRQAVGKRDGQKKSPERCDCRRAGRGSPRPARARRATRRPAEPCPRCRAPGRDRR